MNEISLPPEASPNATAPGLTARDPHGAESVGQPGGSIAKDHAEPTIEMSIEGDGLPSVEVISLRAGTRLRGVVEIIARKAGYEATAAMLFREDEATPIDLEIIIGPDYPCHRKHHVHRCREIDVVVYYGKASHSHCYPPSTRVETVLHWAVKRFGIDATIASEFELTLLGSTEELPGSLHIGSLPKHPACRVELNLVRGVIPNGDGP
jgi:hypothetical protein